MFQVPLRIAIEIVNEISSIRYFHYFFFFRLIEVIGSVGFVGVCVDSTEVDPVMGKSRGLLAIVSNAELEYT